MTQYIETTLSNNEVIEHSFEYHWLIKASIVALYLLSLPTLILFPVAIWYHLSVKKTEVCVTSKRIVKKTGVISVDTDEMRNSKIESIEINQGVIGRIFGYGTIEITGTGISNVKLKMLDNPKQVKRDIESVVFD